MKKVYTSLLILSGIFIFSFPTFNTGHASSRYWLKSCSTGAANTPGAYRRGRRICFTSHERRYNYRDGSQIVIFISVIEIQGVKKKRFRISVPRNVLLHGGVHTFVDRKLLTKLRFRECDVKRCIAEGWATPRILRRLRRGSMLRIGIYSKAGKPYAFDITLRGFNRAFSGRPYRASERRRDRIGAPGFDKLFPEN